MIWLGVKNEWVTVQGVLKTEVEISVSRHAKGNMARSSCQVKNLETLKT